MRAFPLKSVALLLLSLAPSGSWAQQLRCDPCIFGFGKVLVGTSKSYTVHLKNVGTKSLSISSETKQGNAFSVTNLALPYTLHAGERVSLTVTFNPRVAGRTTGLVTFKSSGSTTWIYLSLAGIGITGSELTISPASLNFGNVTVGQSASLASKLSASNGDITISSDQLTSSEFAVHGLHLPVTIPAGQSVPITLVFTPNQSGAAAGKAGFFSNASVSPSVQLLAGTGVAPSAHSADLSWQESDPSVVGFNVYRSRTHGGPYQQINTVLDSSTSYTDSTVAAGTTYYYVTTAVTSAGVQSGYSNEAKAVIPSP